MIFPLTIWPGENPTALPFRASSIVSIMTYGLTDFRETGSGWLARSPLPNQTIRGNGGLIVRLFVNFLFSASKNIGTRRVQAGWKIGGKDGGASSISTSSTKHLLGKK